MDGRVNLTGVAARFTHRIELKTRLNDKRKKWRLGSDQIVWNDLTMRSYREAASPWMGESI
jgi:hypothetical protein